MNKHAAPTTVGDKTLMAGALRARQRDDNLAARSAYLRREPPQSRHLILSATGAEVETATRLLA